jgi:nitrous oxidase accessory protein NosD
MGPRFVSIVLASACCLGLYDCPVVQAAEIINVKNYGAVGDGVTDDTAAIQRAFVIANAAPPRVVVVEFPQGNYLCSATLQVNGTAGTSVVGLDNATLTATGGQTLINFTGSNVTVRNLILAKKVSGQSPILTLIGVKGFTITSNQFPVSVINALSIFNSSNGTIESNTFSLTKNTVALLASGLKTCGVRNNQFVGDANATGSATGIELQHSERVGIDVNNFQNLRFPVGMFQVTVADCLQNTFSNNFECINTQNVSDCEIRGNSLTDGTTGILSQETVNQTIEGNTFTRVPVAANLQNGNEISILKNNIANSESPVTAQHCTKLAVNTNTVSNSNNAGVTLTNCTNSEVVSNRISNSQAQAIFQTNSQGTVKITGNVLNNCGLSTIADPVSAAVIFMDSPGSEISITGNEYSGNIAHLNYFIRCRQPSPPAVISGNKTNTTLPNRIGT